MKYFNYQEQLLLWKKRQLLLQKKFADTPPGFSSEESENAAWQAWEEEYASYLENGRYKINDTPLPSVSLPLIGRETELDTVHDMLASSHTAFLYGIGGIGKTAIALQYIADHRHAYDHVLYVLTDKGISQAICDDTSISISGLKYDRKKYPVMRQYFREKIRILRELSEKKKILIVIDNMNVPADKDLRLFLELPCDKIITTRVNYAIVPETEKLPIKALAPKHWPNLISDYSDDLDPSTMDQLIHYAYQVHGHTLSLKMASVHASYGELPELLDTGFDITSLLSAFRLKENEWKALLFLSVLAPQGMEKEQFIRISGTSEKILLALRDYLLIDFIILNRTASQSTDCAENIAQSTGQTVIPADGSTLLRVHPLISEAVKRITPPTCTNCSSLLRGFATYLYGDGLKIGTWNRTYEENREMEPHIFSLYETFPDPAPWLGTAFEEIATFLWIQGYYDKALTYALKIYENVLDYYGPNHVMPGKEALRVAAVYHNHLDHDHALVWYQKGYDLLKAVTPQTFEVLDQLSIACVKLARGAGHHGDSEAYKKYSSEYRQIVDSILQFKNDHLTDMQKQRLEIKQYYFLLEEAKQALRNEHFAVFEKLCDSIAEWIDRTPNLGYRKVAFEELHVSLLIHKNQLDAAEKAARENVRSTLLYRGDKYKDYLSCLEVMADVLKLENKYAEALSVYEKILIHLQRDYPYEQKWINTIMNKI